MNEHDDDISLEALLEAHRAALQDELHTALPGRVTRYDAASQTADVLPLVRRALERADGSVVHEDFPTLRAVPVLWPRAGAWALHFPLAAGDTVLVVACERDFARWRTSGEVSAPIDRRAHHLAHAVAIPGLFPRARALGAGLTPSDALVLGRDGGATLRIRDDGTVIVDAGEVQLAGTTSLALAPALEEHLAAIAQGLDALMSLVSGVPGAAQPNYGAAAKHALDGLHPIATTKAKGA